MKTGQERVFLFCCYAFGEQVSSMKSDVDYLVPNFCEDWLLKQEKVSFGLLSISITKLIFLLEQP